MEKMRLANHIIISLFFFFNFSTNAFAANNLTGEWEGQYICSQGLTNFTMALTPVGQSETTVEGIFYFFAHESNPRVPSGKYTVKASKLDEQGRFEISPIEWIHQPTGYGFAQVYGSLIEDGKYMKGIVHLPGCKSFYAVNKNAKNLGDGSGLPRGIQSQFVIDLAQSEFEKRTRNRQSTQRSTPNISNIPNSEFRSPSMTGIFQYEVESGASKICFYDTGGRLMALNVSGAQICPLSHTF
ncbi:MAG: hypothetical protein ABJG88_05970 [Litorimonas sp.]